MSNQPPQIQRVDVVLRQMEPADFCQSSKKYDGLSFCFKDGQLTKYSYEPEVFEKAMGADLDWLQSKIDDCPVCRTGLPVTSSELFSMPGSYRWAEELSSFLASFINELADEARVLPPHTVLGSCPPNPQRSQSCYDSGTKTIYIHPLDSGPQVAAHEFKHYEDDVKGRHYSETGAVAFAKAMVAKKFPVGRSTPTDLNTTGPFYGYSKVQSMFEKLDEYYDYVAPQLGVSGNLMNIAWTPEFIALGIEYAEDNLLPNKFHQFLVELGVVVSGLVAGAITQLGLAETDKAILQNISAHMAMKVLKKGMPSEFGIVSSQARDFGRSFAAGDWTSIFGQFGGGAQRVMQDIEIAVAGAANQVASFGRSFGIVSPVGPIAAPMAAEMLPAVATGLGSITSFTGFDLDVTSLRG